MPVEAQTVEYSYLGDGVTTVFPFPSRFLSNSDLRVGVNGAELNAGFTVTGAETDVGGDVTFDVAPANGVTVVLLREPPVSQLIDFINGQTVLEGTLDTALDKLTMICQYLRRTLGKSIRLGDFDQSVLGTLPNKASRALKLIGFDVDGNPTMVTPGPGSGTTTSEGIIDSTAAGRALLTAATHEAQRGLLDVYSTSETYSQTEVDALIAGVAQSPEIIKLADFATPGGLVNAAAGINAAIAACPVGGIVDGAGLTYRADSQLTLKSNMTFQNAFIDFSNAAKNLAMFRAQGADGASVAISSGASRYSNSFVVASAAGLSVGQYIRIRSSDAYEVNTNAAEGEFARVLAISGTTVTLRDGLHSTYTTSPVFYKPTFVENITIRNVRAKGGGVLQNGASSSGHYAVRLELGFNCRVIDCSFDLFDTDNIELSKCYKTWVARCSMTRTYDGGAAATTGGESYGVAVVNGSMYTYVMGNYMEDMRHPVMTGGVEGVVRYIVAHDNQMEGCRAAGMDTHPAADMISFCNNIISAAIGNVSTSSKNGIQHFGGTAVICNNIIRGSYDSGIACQIWAKNRPVSLTISGNQIEHGSGGGAAIYVECSNNPGRLESLTITGNASRDGFTRGCYVVNNNSDLYHFAINGNTFGQTSGAVIEILGGSGRLCEIGSIVGNTGRNAGTAVGCIELNANSGTIQRIGITGNSLFGGSHGIRGSAAGVDRLAVSGNVFNAWATAATVNLGAASAVGNNVTT